jgi:GNAT superfamily N-acetyltransferase
MRNQQSGEPRIELRKLQTKDYDKMVECWNKSELHIRLKGRESQESIKREIHFAGASFIGAFDKESGKLVGLAIGNYDGRRGWINRLAVLPEYRKQGVATVLISRLEVFLKKKGAKVIAALIDRENTSSRTLFGKNGYSNNENILYYSKRESPDV